MRKEWVAFHRWAINLDLFGLPLVTVRSVANPDRWITIMLRRTWEWAYNASREYTSLCAGPLQIGVHR